MKPCTPGKTTEVTSSGSGSALSVYVNQEAFDPGGWWIDVYADTGQDGWTFVKSFVLTPQFRQASRLAGRAFMPGALQWKALVSPPSSATGAIRVGLVVEEECATCCEEAEQKGWSYQTGSGSATVTIPRGARMRSVSCIGAQDGTGTLTLHVWRDATTEDTTMAPIALPAASAPGLAFDLDREDLAGARVSAVVFTNTVAYFVAWME